MELHILGSGSKQGNCYLFKSETQDREILILEAGVEFTKIQKALNFDYSKVVGAIVTHEHGDHFKSVPNLLNAGIDVYTGGLTHKKMGTDVFWRAKNLTENRAIEIGSFSIVPFAVKHDVVQPLGFKISHFEMGTALFLTDTCYSPYLFNGINHMLIEANWSEQIIMQKMKAGIKKKFLVDRIVQNHMSLGTCKEFLIQSDLSEVRNIILVHLSDDNSNAIQFQQEVADLTQINTFIADKNLILNLNKTPF
ncbi:MBL fold metallo-hydrolase [Aquirufa nivalisilvae]|uniref:MBL fold metallo-hydrolase n=1 Tax=Aquirufa nivalisilvae TaxID=2516557 RepID=UPI0022A98D66|nr:MBL fold metallo-hydrolase [Aquirufa nivalisilvae]MCZ2480043.1 MBL fold metallo-hydrolase [Aquirufa nivalisilvae]